MVGEYNTRQIALIKGLFEKNKDSFFTVGQINEYFQKKGIAIGKATIYRQLGRLKESGYLISVKGETKSALMYKLYSENELDIGNIIEICEKCGTVTQVSYKNVDKFCDEIYSKNKFKINKKKLLIYGICKNCTNT